jgi:hypothetical protein
MADGTVGAGRYAESVKIALRMIYNGQTIDDGDGILRTSLGTLSRAAALAFINNNFHFSSAFHFLE